MARHARLLALAALGALAAIPTAANAQATRTWISGGGDDTNACSRTSTCKTLAGAISKTAAWGIINSLDPGGYGAVTVTKAITIDLMSGSRGAIMVPATHGVTVNAGATDDVLLRSITIQGAGDCRGASSPNAAASGVRIIKARSVTLDDVVITNAVAGVKVENTEGNVDVTVTNSNFTNVCTGIQVAPTGTGTANLLVGGSVFAHNVTALSVGSGGTLSIAESALSSNDLAYSATGTGRITSAGGVRLLGNTADGTPTTTIAAEGVAGPQGAVGAQGAAGAPGAAGATGAPGPAGAPPRAPRAVLLVGTPTVARTRVRIPVALSARGNVLVQVYRGKRQVATILQGIALGPRAVTWNRRVNGRRAPRGVYAVRMTAVTQSGATARGVTRFVLR